MNTKQLSMKAVFIATMILLSLSMQAKENVDNPGKTSYKAMASGCRPATAQIDLDINNIRTTLLNGGDMWWNLNDARYEVPKIDPPGSAVSVHSMFAGAVWVGGFDDGGNLKIAAQTYRQTGNDFFPGPLDQTASTDEATCQLFDRFWKVNGADIDNIRAIFQTSGTVNENAIPQGMKEWPARGNIFAKGSAGNPLFVNEDLAPFHDENEDGIYDPRDGDYPIILGYEGTYADQMIFWVYNDRGNIHSETNGQAIGLQINAMAFAFSTSDEINNMTFYKYTLINKSTQALRETYMGQWADPDLGCYLDDYVGCDTTESIGFCYNGDAIDGPCTPNYGATPPIIGIDYFEGPFGDLKPGQTEPDKLGMAAFIYYDNDFSVTGNPETANHYYGYLSGFWKDQTPVTEGGNGYNPAGTPTRYMFPGNPQTGEGWSECSAGNQPFDRRFIQSSGPFTLQPGAVNNITVGVVWVRPGTQTNCNADIAALLSADVKAQALFNSGFKLIDGPDAPTLVIRELDKELIIALVNEAGSNNINEAYDESDPQASTYAAIDSLITDTTYTFQGYKLFQLRDATVTAEDLDDGTKAKLIGQVDLRDGVSRLVNFIADENFGGAFVPYLKVEGEDKGIRHTFRVTGDAFATGGSSLINHKTYYFAAIAYAFNNYKDFDPTNPNVTPPGQNLPYLQGRRNYRIYTGIPHKSHFGNEGSILNAEYGDGVQVTRIEGQGNGGLNLELTQETVDAILSAPDHRIGRPVYEPLRGPVQVFVYDPMKVVNADFELTVIDPDTAQGEEISKDAFWILNNLTTGRIDTSSYTLNRQNETLLPDYGLSISMGQVAQPGVEKETGNGVITGALTFEDELKKWLTGVPDDGIEGATQAGFNWIRSGTYKVAPGENTLFEDYYDMPGIVFRDPKEFYEKIINGTWAPYCMTANQQDIVAPEPILTYGPAFKWNPSVNNFPPRNTLNRLAGVDIVFTDDKSKWSRCVVFELGEEPAFNQQTRDGLGKPTKGQIRQHVSLNIEGTPIPGDTGRAWFPGYAINVETGERLNIAFGEDSRWGSHNGNDMHWNPTAFRLSPIFPRPEVIYGGKHWVYVFETAYDEGKAAQEVLLANYNNVVPNNPLDSLYQAIMWVGTTILSGEFFELAEYGKTLVPPTETKVALRVEKPYSRYLVDGSNNGVNKYQFSTQGMGVETKVTEVAVNALDEIRAVPNPYYAYSAYENSQLDTRIKITNLPASCVVSIYSLDGKLIRRFNRNTIPDTSDGTSADKVNLDNSIEWDLKNNKNIPISSGMYLIHVKAEGLGERVIKWFGSLRPTDLDTF